MTSATSVAARSCGDGIVRTGLLEDHPDHEADTGDDTDEADARHQCQRPSCGWWFFKLCFLADENGDLIEYIEQCDGGLGCNESWSILSLLENRLPYRH